MVLITDHKFDKNDEEAQKLNEFETEVDGKSVTHDVVSENFLPIATPIYVRCHFVWCTLISFWVTLLQSEETFS